MVNRIVNSPITLYEKIKLSSCDLQLSSKHGELTALNSQQSGWCDYHNSSLECKQIELEQVGWACMQDFSNSSSIANSETIITWSNSPDDHEKRMTKLKNAIYDQLDKFLNSESAGDNLLVVHLISAPRRRTTKFNVQVNLYFSMIWPKSWRMIHYKEGAQKFRSAIDARLRADCRFSAGSERSTSLDPEVSSFALYKGGTFVEIPKWHFSKLMYENKGKDVPDEAMLSPAILLHIPLKLKVYWQASHSHFRSRETLARVYLWLEDPFGRTIHDLQRYPKVEVICARPYGSSLQGTLCRHFDPSKDCVVFDDLSVSGVGEHMLLFTAKDHSSNTVHLDAPLIDSDMLTAHMAPFHLVGA
ncbi:hypothetical protein XU18_3833 [Perkinsela sp. CCAP 1560/4]|nr:hypothetical protein XU18_3833 [Perkinsela sp. CCAP 1560/4]|eukprot:KNH05058.1 hypothetical protein XU18_3833 [Perkinsela sp. CCAP 1560/4]